MGRMNGKEFWKDAFGKASTSWDGMKKLVSEVENGFSVSRKWDIKRANRNDVGSNIDGILETMLEEPKGCGEKLFAGRRAALKDEVEGQQENRPTSEVNLKWRCAIESVRCICV